MFEDLISVAKPKISVITPSLNHEKFLVETIESILSQSYRNFEHIVVDGGSKNDTIKILKRYPHIRWISEKDDNIGEAIWKGLNMAKGEYIIQCCVTDGFLDTNWFQRCVEVLDSDNEVSLVWGLPRYMTESGELGDISYKQFLSVLPPQKSDFLPLWLATGFFYPEGNYCVRRGVFVDCFPLCSSEDIFMDHPALGFIYTFNTRGYLPYFLSVIANYGRIHEGQRNSVRWHLENPIKIQYYQYIKAYRKQFFKGKIKHFFRNGNSEIIRVVDSKETKLFKTKTIKYQINQSILWHINLDMLYRKYRQYGIRRFATLMWEKLCSITLLSGRNYLR